MRPIRFSLALAIGLAQTALAQTALRVEPAGQLGCEDCSGPLQFSTIGDIAIVDDRIIWVGDGQEPRIRAFALDGRPVTAFGRRGRGPGEIQGIHHLFPDGGSGVRLVDMLDYRVTHFDSTGKPLSIVRLPSFPFDAGASAAHDVYLLFSQFRPGTSTIRVVRAGADSLVHVRGPIVDFPRPDAPGEIRAMAVSPAGDVVVGEGEEEYRIRVYRRDGTVHDITRAIPRARRTEAEKEAMRSRIGATAARMQAEVGGSGRRAGAPGVPEEKPHFHWTGFRFDPLGRLWVRTGRGNERQAVFDVFDSTFGYAGEVVVPGTVGAFAPGRDLLVTAGETDAGFPVVKVWRVR
ncbi:MAG TPA: hypothetical protein VLE53_17945 [Gemmatimonadaceae bacterium]|nr:hypothetical protein [Gemmatimonadaceae bacterium]